MAPTELILYFDEPRLKMTTVGRIAVRIVSNVAYGLVIVSSIAFVLSDLRSLRATGAIMAFFLIDRALKIGKAEKKLLRLPEGRINVAEYLTPQAYRLIESAFERSENSKRLFILRLLRNVAERREIRMALERMDVPIPEFLSKTEAILREAVSGSGTALEGELATEVEFIAKEAFAEAYRTQGHQVEPKDFFGALMRAKDPDILRLMGSFKIEEGDLESALIFSRFSRIAGLRRLSVPMSKPFKARHRIMNRAWTARPTPTLDNYSEDLTDLARRGEIGFMVGHAREYDALTDILSRPGNQNVILMGEPSAGKSTIVNRLAFQIVKDRVPAPLFDKRLVALSLGSLTAASNQGELESRIKKIIDEIMRAGNVILYIPEIHNLVKTGNASAMSAADILIPVIKNPSFSVIGSTYPKEFKKYIEPITDFASAFQFIRVVEVSKAEATQYLVFISSILERQYKIIISFKAIKQAVTLGARYFREKLLPASAEDLLKEALADVAEKKKKSLTDDDVISIAERRINVPLHAVKEDEAGKLLDMENIIHKKLIDQEEAVKAVSRAVREYRSGLSRRGGPIASFLFVGPTGVGKTELAKILTEIQFGNRKLMLRFDMSEYQDKQSFFRFIGSPDGSVRGALTDAVIEKPYSLILLDEFEKAHPDILNLFLQVFDDGRLTDNMGRTVDFENTIIIATSNAHSEFVKTELEARTPVAEVSERLKRKLTDYFKAELLNRFSGIIVFKPLTPSDIEAVAKFSLDELAGILRENQNIELKFEDAVIKEIARLGYDPAFGARPLRKVISEKIRGVLAEMILRGEIRTGTTVTAYMEAGDIKLR